MQAGLVPGSYVGMGNNGTGCFTTGDGVSLGTPVLYAIHAFFPHHQCACSGSLTPSATDVQA